MKNVSSNNTSQGNFTAFLMTLPLIKVFRPRTPAEAIALCSRLLEYTPTARLTPLEACAHSFFDELRDPNVKLPNGREKPSLFNFTTQGTNRTPHSSSVDVLFTVGPLQPLATSTKLQRALKGENSRLTLICNTSR